MENGKGKAAIAVAALALALALLVAGVAVLVQGGSLSLSQAASDEAGDAASQSASTSSEDAADLAELRASYGDAERQLEELLGSVCWVDPSDDDLTVSFAGGEIAIARSSSASAKDYALSGASSQALSNEEASVVRWTASVYDSSGKSYDLTLDCDANTGSPGNLTCALASSNVLISGGAVVDTQVSTVPSNVASLMADGGQAMREAVATYCRDNLPTATSATCSETATSDYSRGTVGVAWDISGSGVTVLYAVYSSATGEVTVEEL